MSGRFQRQNNNRLKKATHLWAARLVILLLLAAFLPVNAPRPAAAQSGSIRFETLSVEDGLAQSTVRAIMQDSRGFLWFGTEDGLNKYDGYSFSLYLHDAENAQTISHSAITAIYEDAMGDMWIGTFEGLNRFNHAEDTFQRYLHDPEDPFSLGGATITAIVEDIDGNLWVAVQNGGLNRYNRETDDFTRYMHDLDQPDTLGSNDVTALVADKKGGLWVGTNSGLDYFDPTTETFEHFRNKLGEISTLSDNRVLTVFIDQYNILWIGTEEGGLNRMNPVSKTFNRYQHRTGYPNTLASNYVRAVFEDRSGRLWVGGRFGLSLFNRADGTFTRYQHDPNDPRSLSNDYVMSFFQDRSGVLWIGTYGGGLSKYVQTNERFTLFQHRPNVANSLSNDLVHAIMEDRSGAVWVGTMDGGLNRLDPETGAFEVFRSIPTDSSSLGSNDVRAVFQDRWGQIWVGTYGGGLNLYNPETGRFKRYVHNQHLPNSISDNRVMTIYEDQRGQLWVGTRFGGLNLLNRSNGLFSRFMPDEDNPASISGEFVRAIYEDKNGKLWIGTYTGLNLFDPITKRFRHFRHDPNNTSSLSSDRVLTVYQTNDGIIWVGTLLGGLNRLDPETGVFKHYTQKQGLPSDTVYGILGDDQGYLWLSTNRGLSRFDPGSGIFRNYDRRDGLQSYEFSAGAYYKNSQGRLFFGGVSGFNAFYPQEVQDNPSIPPIVITAFKKFNQTERKDLLGGEEIVLSHQDNFVSFEFAALDFGVPEKNQYAYKLEGFDKDWIYAGTRRYASYTNLRGGEYVFRVIGSNQDGVWNDTGALVRIKIIPPVWQQWWFIGGALLAMLSTAVGSYRLRVVRIQNQNRQLEAQVRERTREIERRRQVAEGLREILNVLNSNRSLKETLECIILQMIRLMEARAVIIFRCGEANCPLVYTSNLPDYNKTLPILPNWIASPVLNGQSLALPGNEAQDERIHQQWRKSVFNEFGAMLAVPMAVGDNIDGGLVLLYDFNRSFSDEDVNMALSFSDHTALAIANSQLRAQAEQLAVSAERSRLARDLHDAVTQTLFATSLIAEVLPRLWERNPQAGIQKVNEIRELTRGALAEMRTLLMELRPAALTDVPLSDLLQQLCEAFTGRARVPVKLELEPIELPFNVKIGFYRIAQEALNNIQKHSRATEVEIELLQDEGEVVLCIRDNGSGFDMSKTSPDHFGLGIMEERAQNMGASYQVKSIIGQGTTITVCWTEIDEMFGRI
jgi:ligand-binding sensor domain-containing protein/signal transduction histidine kinase